MNELAIWFILYRFSNYNGGERKIAFSGHDYAPYSLSIAFIDGYIVWSDFTNHSLIRADALNGSNKHTLIPNTMNEVVSLTVIHPSLQPQSKRRIIEKSYEILF